MGDFVVTEPARLWLAMATGAAALLAALAAGKRHGLGARVVAGAVRFAALALVGVALASPAIEAVSETRFEPSGVWQLSNIDPARVDGSIVFRESPDAFAARVRNAIAAGTPPVRTEVYATREFAARTQPLVRALGVPCEAHIYGEDAARESWALGAIHAPLTLKPGEALDAAIDVFVSDGAPLAGGIDNAAGTVVVKVNGNEVGRIARKDAGVQAALPAMNLPQGRHVITCELLGDSSGTVIQRVGHVVRVGAPPRLLAVGLDAAAWAQLETLAPGFTRTAVEPRQLSAAMLRETEVVVMPVYAGVRLTAAQSRELAQFVANGGGLYVTGDGAAQTNQAYLDATFRDLLPVRLLNQKQEPPPDNPVKEEKGESDVAAVSMVFVIDRSNSMNATIKGAVTRWQVAVESVRQALNKLDPWDRAGVLSFTLSQNWQVRPKVIAPFDRELIARRLLALKSDDNYDKQGYNTDIYKAVQEAIAVIDQEKSAVKVIVVLTDGGDRDNDDGTVRDHHKLAELAMSKGINIYALGIGNEFTGADHYSQAAKKVIRNLATKEEFAYIAPDEDAAATAQVVFVRAVEFAYKAYDDKMKEREREKERRPVEPKDPKVDVLEGRFPLALTPVGRQLFGLRELPSPAPRLLKYVRCQLRPDSALAVTLAPAEGEAPALALAIASYGLGRVGFWASGSEPQALGEVSAWEGYPRLVAQTLRWLIPREDPQPRLVGGATTEGIGLLDPLEEARYTLRSDKGSVALALRDGVLVAAQGSLLSGDFEVVERLGTQERVIGDVYLAAPSAVTSRQMPKDPASALAELTSRPPEVTRRRAPAPHVAVYGLIALLCIMPLERLVRRRN